MATTAEAFKGALEAHRAGDFARAYHLYSAVLAHEPEHLDALHLGGVARMRGGEPEEGTGLIARALKLAPSEWSIWNNYGNALNLCTRYEHALEAYERAIALSPRAAMARRNRGVVLLKLGDPRGALESLELSRSLDPADAETHAWIGHAQLLLWNPVSALAAYDEALRLNPELLNAQFGRARALYDRGDHEGARRTYLEIAERHPGADAARAYAFGLACSQAEWSNYEAEMAWLLGGAADSVVPSFNLLSLTDSGEIQRRVATVHADEWRHVARLSPRDRTPRRRLRVAYLSCDFREHATAFLITAMLEAHDRASIDVYCYSWGADDGSDWRRRIRAASTQFRDVHGISDARAAELIRDDDIDILVDLKGYTENNRIGILARHPARVQVSWLGYPGTLGASFVEYLIADSFIVPAELEHLYAERVVRLPHTYQPNDPRRSFGTLRPRRDWGLPDEAFVYCSFAQGPKVTPRMFSTWMNILRRVPGSVLWLLTNPGAFERNLRTEAARAGVDPARVIFATRLPTADHLSRYPMADLALDTFPCGSHTTASDALWAGCPLLALAGETFASRVSGSVVRAAGLPDSMIAHSFTEFEERAVALAQNRDELAQLRARLRGLDFKPPLFDAQMRAKDVTRAYHAMFDRWQQGLAPEHVWLD